ncbi:MAG: hypothetical protein ACLQNU_05880 [Candidatus Dormibacteria bacterium]
MTGTLLIALPVFGACAAEMIEALTIVMAPGAAGEATANGAPPVAFADRHFLGRRRKNSSWRLANAW